MQLLTRFYSSLFVRGGAGYLAVVLGMIGGQIAVASEYGWIALGSGMAILVALAPFYNRFPKIAEEITAISIAFTIGTAGWLAARYGYGWVFVGCCSALLGIIGLLVETRTATDETRKRKWREITAAVILIIGGLIGALLGLRSS